MNNRPLYENLDTAFVNLSALVKYLRRRKFVGRVRIELNNYEGDIFLYEGNKLNAREHDKISGRVTEGEEAFHILLIRAREGGGTIHVYHAAAKEAVIANDQPEKQEAPVRLEAPVKAQAKAANGSPSSIPKPVEPVAAVIPKAAEPAQTAAPPKQNVPTPKVVKISEPPKKIVPAAKLPKFPFDLHNKVEERARRTRLSADDWNVLLGLTGELLGAIDKSLGTAKLDFTLAFSKARSEISADYPFLNPSGGIFEYGDGKISMREQVNGKLFVAGVTETLRRILDKLGTSTKFAEVYRRTAQQVLALINQRKPHYDKFGLTAPLKKILGV